MFKAIESTLIRAYRSQGKTGFFSPVLRFIKRTSQRPFMRPFITRLFIEPEIRSMLGKLYPKDKRVNTYIREARSSAAMQKHFREWQSGDFQVMFLYTLIRLQQPDNIVETGIASGRSSTAILDALDRNGSGHLYSIDLPAVYKGKKRTALYIDYDGNRQVLQRVPDGEEPGWLIPSRLRGRWTRILGDTWEETPKLSKELPQIDIFYHDSDHTNETMLMEFNAAWPKIPPGGFLICDDAPSTDAFEIFKKKNEARFEHVYFGLGVLQKK